MNGIVNDVDEWKQRRREIDRKSYAKHRERRLEKCRRWRLENPEKVRAIKRRWALNNPEKVKEHRRRSPPKFKSIEQRRHISRKSLYGLSPEMFEAMLIQQNYSCKICGTIPKSGRTLAVDHCHETGKIRGLLCTACNVAIGNLGDNEAGLRRALQYLTDA